jgi:hypothetical protein
MSDECTKIIVEHALCHKYQPYSHGNLNISPLPLPYKDLRSYCHLGNYSNDKTSALFIDEVVSGGRDNMKPPNSSIFRQFVVAESAVDCVTGDP